MSSKMINELIIEIAKEVIDEVKSQKEEERMVVVATYNEDEDVEETDTESVFLIPKGVDLDDADEVEYYRVKNNNLEICYANGKKEWIEPLIGRDNDLEERLFNTDISIMWKKSWCDAYRDMEEEIEKRLNKVKRITKKLKQDAIERHLADKGKRLSNLRRHTEKSLDGVIEKHNIDIKYYQRLFIREKIEEEIEDKRVKIRRERQQEEWKNERDRKEYYLEEYDIPLDTMAKHEVLRKHLIRFMKDKDPEFVERNQYLKRQKEITEEKFREARIDYYGYYRGGNIDFDNGYEEEISEEVIERWTRISRNHPYEQKEIFYKCKLGYYLD